MITQAVNYFCDSPENICRLAYPILDYKSPKSHPLKTFCSLTLDYSALQGLPRGFQDVRRTINKSTDFVAVASSIVAFTLDLFDALNFLDAVGFQVPVAGKKTYQVVDFTNALSDVFYSTVDGDILKSISVYARIVKMWIVNPQAKLCLALLRVGIDSQTSPFVRKRVF